MNFHKRNKVVLNIIILFVFLWGGMAAICYSPETPQEKIFSIKLESRAFQPGEAVLIRLENIPSFREAALRFKGKKIPFIKLENNNELMAVIGLDMDTKPGFYSLKITLALSDGSLLEKEKRIVVEEKSFPVKKLWVEEKFVTPPLEVIERIQREARIIQGVYSLVSNDWYGKGRFILPVEGRVTPNFGEKRIYNNKPRSAHNGVDIASPAGTPIRASNSGKIVLASDLYFAGKSVIIDHGLGVFTFYCHLSEITVKRGTSVKKGEVIGKAGATGRVTGPHLHWSVRVNDGRVDPMSLLTLDFPE